MTTYFATFVPGFGNLITEVMKKDFADIRIHTLFESSILFETQERYSQVKKKHYFNNVFYVLNFFHIERGKKNGSVVKELHKNADPQVFDSVKKLFPEARTFRVMIQHGSDLVSVPKEFTAKMMHSLPQQTKLEHSPLKADIEFWFMIRQEKFGILGVKSMMKTGTESTQKGQLKHQLAYLLNLLSEPHENDIYLDPFAGHGALALDRTINFPSKNIYTSDDDSRAIQNLKLQFKDLKQIIIKKADALKLDFLADGSITKIVTDPPWGSFQMQKVDYELFYKEMLTEMRRVIKPEGIIVILTAKKEEFELALQTFNKHLILQKKFSTLVNGKKTGVYKIIVK